MDQNEISKKMNAIIRGAIQDRSSGQAAPTGQTSTSDQASGNAGTGTGRAIPGGDPGEIFNRALRYYARNARGQTF